MVGGSLPGWHVVARDDDTLPATPVRRRVDDRPANPKIAETAVADVVRKSSATAVDSQFFTPTYAT